MVFSSFIDEFYRMETSGILDPVNEVHLLSFHLLYLQEVNKSLKEFTKQWN